jgi:hypothetical protein
MTTTFLGRSHRVLIVYKYCCTKTFDTSKATSHFKQFKNPGEMGKVDEKVVLAEKDNIRMTVNNDR